MWESDTELMRFLRMLLSLPQKKMERTERWPTLEIIVYAMQ
jgi:hypothetical protein